jgi:RNA-binding protein YhbY
MSVSADSSSAIFSIFDRINEREIVRKSFCHDCLMAVARSADDIPSFSDASTISMIGKIYS